MMKSQSHRSVSCSSSPSKSISPSTILSTTWGNLLAFTFTVPILGIVALHINQHLATLLMNLPLLVSLLCYRSLRLPTYLRCCMVVTIMHSLIHYFMSYNLYTMEHNSTVDLTLHLVMLWMVYDNLGREKEAEGEGEGKRERRFTSPFYKTVFEVVVQVLGVISLVNLYYSANTNTKEGMRIFELTSVVPAMSSGLFVTTLLCRKGKDGELMAALSYMGAMSGGIALYMMVEKEVVDWFLDGRLTESYFHLPCIFALIGHLAETKKVKGGKGGVEVEGKTM